MFSQVSHPPARRDDKQHHKVSKEGSAKRLEDVAEEEEGKEEGTPRLPQEKSPYQPAVVLLYSFDCAPRKVGGHAPDCRHDNHGEHCVWLEGNSEECEACVCRGLGLLYCSVVTGSKGHYVAPSSLVLRVIMLLRRH